VVGFHAEAEAAVLEDALHELEVPEPSALVRHREKDGHVLGGRLHRQPGPILPEGGGAHEK